MKIITDTDKYITGTYKRFPVAIKNGKGSLVYDFSGREYIDLGSGIAVNAFGAADDEFINAVKSQLEMISHTSNYYYTLPQAELAELLCKKTHFKNVFFCNSGAEANEAAIKAARKYFFDKTKRQGRIVTLKNSFHGRTITTLAASGQDELHSCFHPFTEGFSYAEANYASTKELLGDDCAALMIELIQGEGGVCVLDKEYVEKIALFCKERDILLIVDEVQTGNGRTGRLFCYEHYGIKPDIVTTAKGLGGGLPIGAVLFGEKTAKTFSAGTHGSTFGGNPVCAAGAYSVIKRLDGDFLSEVAEKGRFIKDSLAGLDNLVSVDGIGLMVGIKTKKDAKEVALECINRGLLVLTAKDKVRLLPALNIPFDILKKGIKILAEVIEE